MKTRTTSKTPDTYMALIRRLPLRPIRNDAQHAAAVALLAELDGKPQPDQDELDCGNTLALLVKDYERPRVDLKSSAVDRLRHLMNEVGVNVSAIGKVIGSQSAASMVLREERALSKEHIRRLADHFHLQPGAFM